MKFCIVTPCLNAARFIDETIFSVLSQAGPFQIRYHIQDGGSTDGTLEKLERWRRMLEAGLPCLCEHIEFTYAGQKDDGLYDAVNRGFAACGEGDVLSWINADDRYQPAAFVAVAAILDKFHDVRWVTGSTCLIAEAGFDKGHMGRVLFPRTAIQAGIYDGRVYPFAFVQQEGTFWRPELWQQAGGLKSLLRFAGDYCLWRRFSAHSELVVVDRALGCFRMREGRLSQNLVAYYAEVDGLLSEPEQRARERVSATFQSCRTEQELVANGFVTTIAYYSYPVESWQLVRSAGTKFNFAHQV
jgi:glycosyltransferase involved in cell wall biosynthesis